MADLVYVARVTGDPDKSGFAPALERHPDLMIFARSGVGMIPPDGPSDVASLASRSFSVHVRGVDSKEAAQEAVERVIAEVDGAHAVQQVSDPIDMA